MATILRELIARIKVETKRGAKDLREFNKLLDETKKALQEVADKTVKIDVETSKSTKKRTKEEKEKKDAAKEAAAAARKEAKAERDRAKEARKRAKAERDRAKEARKAELERRRAARDAARAARDRERAERKAAREEAKNAKDRERALKKRIAQSKELAVGLRNLAVGAVGLGFGGAAAALGFAGRFAEEGGELERQSRQFDIPVDQLQRLAGAAKLAGVDQDELTDSLKEFRVKLKETQEDGVTPFSEALSELGLEVKDVEGKPFEAQLKIISNSLQTLSEGADRTKVLMELFGEEAGVRMGPLLDRGGQQIDKFIKRFVELGGVMDKEAIEQAAKLRDELKETRIVMGAGARDLGQLLAPAVKQVAGEFREWLQTDRELKQQRIGEFIKDLTGLMKDLIPVVGKTAKSVTGLVDEIGGIEPALKLAAGGFVAFKLAALGPIGAVAAGIVGIITLMDALESKLNRDQKRQEAITRSAFEDPDTGGLTDAELQQSGLGRVILKLKQERDKIAMRFQSETGAGGPGGEALGEFGFTPVQVQERQRKLNAQLKKIDSQIAKGIAELQIPTSSARAPTSDEAVFGLRSTADLLREDAQRRATRVRQSGGAKASRVKSKSERDATLGEALGFGKGGPTLSGTAGRSLGTTVVNQTFNIGIPSIDMRIEAASGATVQSQAAAVRDAVVGQAIPKMVRDAQRASIGALS